MSTIPLSNTALTEEALYGTHAVLEAMRSGKRRVVELQLDENASKDRFSPLIRIAKENGIRIHTCSKHELFENCGTRQHQGAVLITTSYPYSSLTDDVFEQPRLLLLDNIEDPRNAGAILRSAHLFGFNTVLLPLKGGAGIYPSVVKTSAGASEHLTIIQAANSTKYFQRARKAGYRTVALDAKGGNVLSEIPVDDSRPLLLIMGGEDKRIGQFILNESEIVARIPQQGNINSLNASVAAGIALYHFSQLEEL
ncbi:23S rRNA (guanosine(2251)-2'-O)-methyltransferase RlmB [Kiritimatiellota bacterium B12222]|nr:23S rRNA (guanosine(2251)-2'-O)-methyltransferase RlmB [Kiritimatiellota bacterium B12222]